MRSFFMKKYFFYILILSIFLLSISSVCGSDLVNGNDLNLTSASNDVIENDVDDEALDDVDLIVDKKKVYYSDTKANLIVNVHDKQGHNVDVGTVTFIDVFGKNCTSDVVDGYAKCSYKIKDTGQYNITCFYDGKGIYNNATTTYHLTIAVEDTVCHNLHATRYGEIVYFAGNILSVYESHVGEVGEGTVSFYVDGKKVGVSGVDTRGNFAYIWKSRKNLIGKTIKVTMTYTNNLNHYHSSQLSKTFSFKAPTDTQIIYNIRSADKSRKLISGIVKDKNGKAVIGGTLNINNIYSVPVDNNGKFRFYITKGTNKKVNYKIGYFNWGSKADITANKALMNGIKHTPLIDKIINLCKKGIPYIKFGNGNGKTVVISSGTHGGEIASQVACYNLIDMLANFGYDIDGTIYIFPAIYPEAIANNTRTFNGINMNGVANVDGTVSNNFIKFAKSINAAGLGDFHCTRHNDKDLSIDPKIYSYRKEVSLIGNSEFPGTSAVLCTLKPSPECFSIAKYIHKQVVCSLIYDYDAGVAYSGAIDDNANLLGVPAVTCEALTNHGNIEYGSIEVSYSMMIAFLKYFGFDINEMITVPLNGNDLMLIFTSPYNYNPSFKHILLSDSPKPHHNITPNKDETIVQHTTPIDSYTTVGIVYIISSVNVNNASSESVNVVYSSFNLHNFLSLIFKLISMFMNIIILMYDFIVKFIFSIRFFSL